MFMDDELTYENLWQAYQKEKQSNELQLIPKTFYDDMKEYIDKAFKGGAGEDSTQQRENAMRLLNGIFERRKQKILIYAAYGKQLPSPSTQQEADFYEQITKAIKASTLNATHKESQPIALRSMQSIPEILLPSGSRIGPLEKEQVVEIKNREDASFLINNKICRQL